MYYRIGLWFVSAVFAANSAAVAAVTLNASADYAGSSGQTWTGTDAPRSVSADRQEQVNLPGSFPDLLYPAVNRANASASLLTNSNAEFSSSGQSSCSVNYIGQRPANEVSGLPTPSGSASASLSFQREFTVDTRVNFDAHLWGNGWAGVTVQLGTEQYQIERPALVPIDTPPLNLELSARAGDVLTVTAWSSSSMAPLHYPSDSIGGGFGIQASFSVIPSPTSVFVLSLSLFLLPRRRESRACATSN